MKASLRYRLSSGEGICMSGMARGLPLSAASLLVLLLAFVLVPLVVVAAGSPAPTTWARALALGAALVVIPLMVAQAAAAARLRLADRLFGHDIVMWFHRRAGLLVALLAISHPVLLTIDEGTAWLLSFHVGWRVTLGKVALLGVLATGAIMRVAKLDYLRRRRLHGMAAGVSVVAAWTHGMLAGSHFESAPVKSVWWALLGAYGATLAYRKVVVPRWVRRAYTVAAVTRETHDTWTLRLAACARAISPPLPGQFVFARIDAAGRREEHPFSISSAPPHGRSLEITIKESGDFTRGIGSVQPGSLVLVEGPFGRFSHCLHDPRAFLFIAGGVGITPLMSMLRHLRDCLDQRPVVLLCGNKTEADILFRDELASLPAHVRVVHVLSSPQGAWRGPSGHVTAEAIRVHATDVLETADVYLCGPPPMMARVIEALRELGVPWRRIHYERFSLEK